MIKLIRSLLVAFIAAYLSLGTSAVAQNGSHPLDFADQLLPFRENNPALKSQRAEECFTSDGRCTYLSA